MRAEVAKAEHKLPPVKGWKDVHTPGTWLSTGKWSSGDQTLECSHHLSAEPGPFVRQTDAMSIL